MVILFEIHSIIENQKKIEKVQMRGTKLIHKLKDDHTDSD